MAEVEEYQASIDNYLDILHLLMDQYDEDPRPSLLGLVISRHNYIRGLMWRHGVFDVSAESAHGTPEAVEEQP